MHRILALSLGVTLAATACGGDVGIVAPGNQDADQDGVFSDQDCDDTDPSVFPGAQEIGDDGIDQDCDGTDALTEYGHRDDLETTFLQDSFLIGNRVTFDEPLTVTHLGLAVREPADALFRLALYTSDGGRPSALLVETAPSGLTEGVNEIPVLKQVTVDAGDYWLLGVTDVGVGVSAGEVELVVYTEFAFSEPFEDPIPTMWDYEGPRLSFFAVGEIPEI